MQLRAVLVRCIEQRALMACGNRRYTIPAGTDAERLARAKKKLAERKAALIAQLDRLLKAHMDCKTNHGPDHIETQMAARKVEECDTALLILDRPEVVLCGVAYHCWRAGLNSVATAGAVGIKPPLVRKLCWQMRQVASELGYGPGPATRGPRARLAKLRYAPLPKRFQTCCASARRGRKRGLLWVMTASIITHGVRGCGTMACPARHTLTMPT